MTYETEVLADSPLVYWRLGEASGTAAADDSGNGNDGTYFGSPTLGEPGYVDDADTAVGFGTVTSQRVESNAPVHGTSTLPTFAMECIAQLLSGSGPDSLMLLADPAGVAPDAIQLDFQADDPSVSFSFTGTTHFGTVSAFVTNSVQHIVAEFTGTHLNLYINGELAGTTAVTDAGALFHVANSFGVPWVGAGGTLLNPHVFDEAAFYDHDLGIARVRAHAAAAFFYFFPPLGVVSSVSPANGPVGSLVTIGGSGFNTATAAKVGGITSPTFTVFDDSHAQVEIPVGASGAAAVQVENASGLSAATDPDNTFTVDAVIPVGPAPDGCMALSFPGFVADGVTPDGDTIIYTVQALDGWFDSPPIRTGTLEANPRGETITVARENARTVDVQIVAHTLGGLPLGSPLCFTAVRSIKTAFRALYVPVLMDVLAPSGQERTMLARRVGPIKTQILGESAAVRFDIPMLGEDPRLTTV